MQKLVTPALLLLCLGSCGNNSPEKPTLVTSIYPIEFMVGEIAGDEYNVVNIVPPGTEPHDFELTVSAAKALQNCSAFFASGLGMEHYYDSLNDSIKAKTTILSKGLATQKIDGRDDPHIWLDTALYKQMAGAVTKTLSSLSPARAKAYEQNYSVFSDKIDELTAKCESIASSFQNKVIAVSHAAYGYMCHQFGVEQIHISGLSPDEEPSQKGLESLIDIVEEKGIDTIFFEELASPEIASAIASSTGAKTEELNPLESLSKESVEAGENYFTVYEENIQKIAQAKP